MKRDISQRIIFKNCTLLDGTENMKPQENIDVLVENGRITQIGDVNTSDSDMVVDLTGKYLMPGLINLHVHLPAGGRPSKKPMNAKLMAKLALSNSFMRAFTLKLCHSYAMQGLMSGVTTIRTVGGLDNIDTKLRNKINSGKLEGPRIFASDFAIGVPDGHMSGSVARSAETVEDAVRMVDELHDNGVDIVKLMITGGVMDAKVKGEPGTIKMNGEMIKACCDKAHSYGLKVAAHVQSPDGIKLALSNGVDSIEHGSAMDDEIISGYKNNNAVMVCTISPAMVMAKFEREVLGISEAVQYNSNVVMNSMIEGAKSALKNGIAVGLGTDTGCPYTTHYNMWRELHYFKNYVGVTPEFALHSATLNNAKILGADDIIGSVETGKQADFMITEKNPLDDFRTMEQPYMVVSRGKIFSNPKVKKYESCESELDKYYNI